MSPAARTAADELARHPTTAVITYNDRMAIGLIRRLTTLGARIPDDVSVIGFDNIFPAELVTPPLTTVAAPLQVMGTVAVHNLLAIIAAALMHALAIPPCCRRGWWSASPPRSAAGTAGTSRRLHPMTTDDNRLPGRARSA